MPSYLFGNYLNHIVSVHFPGGVEEAAKRGCDITHIFSFGSEDLVYFLLPEKTTKDLDLSRFKRVVEEAAKQHRITIRWVSSHNCCGDFFSTLAAITAMENSLQQLDPQARILLRPAVTIVQFGCTKERAHALLRVFEIHKIVRRVVVATPEGLVEKSWDFPDIESPSVEDPSEFSFDMDPAEEGTLPDEQHAPSPVMEAAPTDRKKPITLGDVADLASLIEGAATVEDLLNRI